MFFCFFCFCFFVVVFPSSSSFSPNPRERNDFFRIRDGSSVGKKKEKSMGIRKERKKERKMKVQGQEPPPPPFFPGGGGGGGGEGRGRGQISGYSICPFFLVEIRIRFSRENRLHQSHCTMQTIFEFLSIGTWSYFRKSLAASVRQQRKRPHKSKLGSILLCFCHTSSGFRDWCGHVATGRPP